MEQLSINNVWMMICTALVFFMHLGFALLEIGLTRQKKHP
jgi:Amt family ammonium transporter